MGNHIHKAWRKESRIKTSREPPDLPVEILLDIFSRADGPATLVRCAATSKLLRRHVTDPAFLRRFLQRHGDGGSVPSLLAGLFFDDDADVPRRFVPVPPFAKLTLSLAPTDDHPDDPASPYSYKPVASRGGLVVLRRHTSVPGAIDAVVDLCSGNSMTGHYVFLPPSTVYGYSHVLLPGEEDGDEDDDGTGRGRSFRLLVSDKLARTQTFSPRAGSWGAVAAPPAHLHFSPYRFKLARPSAVVLRDAAHWLYHDDHGPPSSQRYGVLAVSVSTGHAAAIEVPQRCLRRRRREVAGELLLVRSADGRRLGLLVAEALGIAIWTLMGEESRSWVRSVVVDRAGMLQSLTLLTHPLCCLDTELEWFGESSGTVVLQLRGAGILLLRLRTGEVTQFSKGDSICVPLECCPYEMDLVSPLALMNPSEL